MLSRIAVASLRATRTMSTSAQPSSSNTSKFALFAGAAVGAGALVASQIVNVEAVSKKPTLAKAKVQIADIIGDLDVVNPSCDDGAQGGGGGIAPMLLRLAWHSSGTYDAKAKNGGSEGATMRFAKEAAHGGNAGLQHARALLEPVKAANPDLTYADLYVLAGVVAIEEMGGPNVGFRWGRSDAVAEADPSSDDRFSPDGRLPDGDKPSRGETIQHLRDIFYRMGFDEYVLLLLLLFLC
jgi:cytochrome c peroxidase